MNTRIHKAARSGITLILAAVIAAACGSGAEKNAADTPKKPDGGVPAVSQEPVTLNFFTEGNAAVLAPTIEELTKKKFPYITLKTTKSGGDTTISSVVGAGEIPDLISFSLGGISQIMDLQLPADLNPLIKKFNFDLNRLAPGVVETVRSYSNNDGRFLVMPFELNNNALFYNKGIFDKFGVAYPRDGMNWDDLYDVAKKVTRMDGGVQYKGFRFEETNLTYKDQMGLTFVDPKTYKATVNTDAWKQWLVTMTRFFEIPGNTENTKVAEKNEFLKDRILAMRTGPNFLSELPEYTKQGFDWDVVSLPEFKGMEGKGTQMNSPYYVVTAGGKHQDQSFQVVAYLMSDEVQTILSKQGRIPIVKSDAVRKSYGTGFPEFAGKNLQAFFKDTIAKPIPLTPYDKMAKSSMMKKGIRGITVDHKDANTALREVEEDINKKIAAAQAANGVPK